MNLTKDQINSFKKNGFISLKKVFTKKEINSFLREIDVLKTKKSDGNVFENDGKTLRALHGSHFDSDLFNDLTANIRLHNPSSQILSSNEIYTYQFKINFKSPFYGKSWPWHRDFTFWKIKDGMLEPNALNCAIFLDECNEFNGSLMMIKGSHNLFDDSYSEKRTEIQNEKKSWESDVNENLTFIESEKFIKKIATDENLYLAKGEVGTVLYFHPNLIHASNTNLSPFNRRLLIITYNTTSNAPVINSHSRPNFLVNYDSSPIIPKLTLNNN